MKTERRIGGSFLVLFLGAIQMAAAVVAQADAAAPAAQPGVTILGNDTYLRTHFTYRTPMMLTADGQLKPLPDPTSREGKPIADFASPPPPADWTATDFDDSTWERRRAPVEPDQLDGYTYSNLAAWHSAVSNSLICLRGRFIVDDPGQVQDLKLSLEYVGGVAVYLNGREVARRHLPEKEKGSGTLAVGSPTPFPAEVLAEKYPDDLYCEPGGAYLQDVKKNRTGFDRRYRTLAEVAVPAEFLRKGLNVLAMEVHRSPVNEAAVKAKRAPVGGMYVVPGLWPYAELRRFRLSAAAGSAVTPNVARPAGIQVWSCAPDETVTAGHYGDPGEPRPVAITAARNGVFSGRFVVSAAQAIKGLKVRVSDLRRNAGGDSGALPASAVQVRLAEPAVPAKTSVPTFRYDGLLEAIPAEVPVVRSPLPREYYLRNGAYEGEPIARTDAAGAVAPIWFTVRVPKDAAPGLYGGTVRVEAEGLPPVSVPIRVTVADWAVPDPKDFRVHHLGFNSPESLARHYEVPLWSDRHFQLMAKSLGLMTEIGSRQVLVDLAIDWYGVGGNQESVVRWVAQADGSYTHDFTVLEKYLDVVAKAVGKPLPLRFNCWPEVRPGWSEGDPSAKTVSRLDPATGRLEPLPQPPPGTPESLAFWKPVLDEVRKRVEARGWFDVTCLGHNSYNAVANPAIVGVARQIWPDGAWGFTAHSGQLNMTFATAEKGVGMPVRYSECVWTRGNLRERGTRALLQPRPAIWNWSYRGVARETSPLTLMRDVAEGAILRGHDGMGQLGADIFPIKGPGGRPFTLNVDRGGLGPHTSTLSILAPGPDGPIATERYEMLREGTELAEAVIFLERAIAGKKLAADLEAKVNRCLDERSQSVLWRWSTGRRERDRELLALAAEAARSLGAGK